jgi:hypothetical protein
MAHANRVPEHLTVPDRKPEAARYMGRMAALIEQQRSRVGPASLGCDSACAVELGA